MFTEVFERFRDLFLLVFHGHIFFYVGPLHIHLGRWGPRGPWANCAAAVSMITLFKPYPTATDVALMLSLLLTQIEMVEECEGNFIFFLSGATLGIGMYPEMTAMWITRNAGNANFLYNMHLVFHVFAGLLVAECIKSGVRLRRRKHVECFVRQEILDKMVKDA